MAEHDESAGGSALSADHPTEIPVETAVEVKVEIKVTLRNPSRELAVSGPMSVPKLLKKLDLNRESVLVIRNGTLVPGDAVLEDGDEVEIRPVISGG